MADSIKINQQLNDLLQDRQKVLEKNSAEMKSQIALASGLTAALGGEEANKVLDKIRGMAASLDEVARNAKKSGDKAGDALDRAADEIEKTKKGNEGLIKSLVTSFKNWKDHLQIFKDIGDVIKLVFYPFQKMWDMMTKTLKSTSRVFSSVWEVIKQGGESSVGIFKAIVSGLEQMEEGLIGMAKQWYATFLPLMQEFENVRGSLGNLKEGLAANVVGTYKLANSFGNLANSGRGLYSIFGTAQAALQFFRETAEQMTRTGTLFGPEFQADGNRLLILQKGLDLTGEQLDAFAGRALAAGTTLDDQLSNAANLADQLGKKYNVSSKLIGKALGKMAQDTKNFASLTQKELTASAAYMTKLGVTADDLQGVINNFDNWDDAATNVSKLTQAFGLNLDAMQLMTDQDPSKRVQDIRDAFFAAGNSVEHMSRQERSLLAATSGVSEQALNQVFSLKNQSVSYDDILKSADEAEKKQKNQTQLMMDMGANIAEVVRQLDLGVNFLDDFFHGLTQGVTQSTAFKHLMSNITDDLIEIWHLGRDIGKAMSDANTPVKTLLDTLSMAFDPVKYKAFASGLREILIGAQDDVKKTLQGSNTDFSKGLLANLDDPQLVRQGVDKIFGVFQKFLYGDANSGITKSLGDAFWQSFTALDNIIAALIPNLSKSLASGIETAIFDVVDMDPLGKLFDLLTGNFTVSKGQLSGPISRSLSEAFTDPKTRQSLSRAFNRMMGYLALQFTKWKPMIVTKLTDLWNAVSPYVESALETVFFGIIDTAGSSIWSYFRDKMSSFFSIENIKGIFLNSLYTVFISIPEVLGKGIASSIMSLSEQIEPAFKTVAETIWDNVTTLPKVITEAFQSAAGGSSFGEMLEDLFTPKNQAEIDKQNQEAASQKAASIANSIAQARAQNYQAAVVTNQTPAGLDGKSQESLTADVGNARFFFDITVKLDAAKVAHVVAEYNGTVNNSFGK